MSIRGGQIVTQAGKYVLDRIQSAGPGDLSIPEEKIYELGNYQSVATIRDIPEITFDLESFDTSCEFEAVVIGKDPTAFSSTVGSNSIDFANAVPIDIISPWKSRRGQFDIVKGVIIPYLTLANASYRFGVGSNATQSFSFQGDSIFYTPGQPNVQEFANSGVGPYTLTNTATVYSESGKNVYVLSVCLKDSTTGASKRLFFDSDEGATPPAGYYKNTSTTLTLGAAEQATYDTVHVTYGSTAAASYTQTGNNPSGQPVHVAASIKPAAIRAKDIDIYIGSTDATPVFSRLTSVQSVDLAWSVSLEKDEELGNERSVAYDYDVPEVSGSVGLKPFDPADLFAKIAQFTGVNSAQVIGPNVTVSVPMEVRINHPDTGARLKTFYVPDARFTVPGYNGQVQTKLENTVNWASDASVMYVYNGSRV